MRLFHDAVPVRLLVVLPEIGRAVRQTVGVPGPPRDRAQHVARREADAAEDERERPRERDRAQIPAVTPDHRRGERARDARPVVAARRRHAEPAIIGQEDRPEHGHGEERAEPSQRQRDEQSRIVSPLPENEKVERETEQRANEPADVLRVVPEELRPVRHEVRRIERLSGFRIDVGEIALRHDEKVDETGQEPGAIQYQLDKPAAERPGNDEDRQHPQALAPVAEELVRAHAGEHEQGRHPVRIEPVERALLPMPGIVHARGILDAERASDGRFEQVLQKHRSDDEQQRLVQSREPGRVGRERERGPRRAHGAPEPALEKRCKESVEHRVEMARHRERNRVHVRN